MGSKRNGKRSNPSPTESIPEKCLCSIGRSKPTIWKLQINSHFPYLLADVSVVRLLYLFSVNKPFLTIACVKEEQIAVCFREWHIVRARRPSSRVHTLASCQSPHPLCCGLSRTPIALLLISIHENSPFSFPPYTSRNNSKKTRRLPSQRFHSSFIRRGLSQKRSQSTHVLAE